MSDIALPNRGVPELPRAERLLSDELLAKLTGRGSGRAFTTLYERYHQAIYRYCRAILRNDHDAQDALQSTMMRAYAALRVREREVAVRPWLFRIAHNEAISITRKRGRGETIDDDLEHPVGLEQTVELRQRLSRLVSDMGELPERQRAALVMRELNGLSIEEIAVALDISQGTAKQTLFEARGSLHDLAEGREMECERVREAISRNDGRVLRGRRIGAHLRECGECRAFRTAIDMRSADLRALAPPLPAITASAVLGRLLAHAGGHASGAATSGATLAGGHAAGGSLLAKSLVGVAVMTAAAGTVKLTVEHHAEAARHSDGHRAGPHTHAAMTSSPTAGGRTPPVATSRSQHKTTGAKGGASVGFASAAGTSTRAASPMLPGQLVPGSNGAGQATHGGSAYGVARGNTHHTAGKRPAHHAHGHSTNPGSRHSPSHTTHPTQGRGDKSQATHGQSGTTSGGDHGAIAPAESHPSQSGTSGGENARHASEATPGVPPPSR